MFDTLLLGGTVIDGTGRTAFAADIAIENGKIAAVGQLSHAAARRVVDCTGLTVTPGFIDIHRHADGAAFRPGFGEWELCQGLTTIVNGNCGLSAAPFGPDNETAIRAYLQPITGTLPPRLDTRSMAGYFRSLPALPLNVAMLVGAGTLRADTAGYQLTAISPPSTGRWSAPLPTGPWASVWALATRRSASTPPLISSGPYSRWPGRISPSPSTCGRRAAAWRTPWRR